MRFLLAIITVGKIIIPVIAPKGRDTDHIFRAIVLALDLIAVWLADIHALDSARAAITSIHWVPSHNEDLSV